VTRAKTSLPPELDIELRIALNKAIRRNPLVLRADTVLALIAPAIDAHQRRSVVEELQRLAMSFSPEDDVRFVMGALFDRIHELQAQS